MTREVKEYRVGTMAVAEQRFEEQRQLSRRMTEMTIYFYLRSGCVAIWVIGKWSRIMNLVFYYELDMEKLQN